MPMAESEAWRVLWGYYGSASRRAYRPQGWGFAVLYRVFRKTQYSMVFEGNNGHAS
jgi:hypothetical protein